MKKASRLFLFSLILYQVNANFTAFFKNVWREGVPIDT